MTTLGLRYPEWQLRPHGTLAAYRRHYRHGEKPCEACKKEYRRIRQDREQSRKGPAA